MRIKCDIHRSRRTDGLELARTVALDPTLDPREPGVQPIEEGPRSCSTQHDDDGGTWKSILWFQKMQHEGGGGTA